ncbi:MAG: VOC family protein [Phycisphaerales bacterium]|jgi:hypothetical protein|nr:VOC family protein [Phycisphaerales bacterium]
MTTDTLTMEPITARQFCWQECTTRDTVAAGAFYSELFGWTQEVQAYPEFNYTIFQSGEAPIAGMMAMDAEWPAEIPAHWMSYVAVTEIEAVAARVTECGGSLCVPVTAIPPGKFCVVTDPTGAVFSLFEGGDGVNATGDRAFGWWELATTDVERARTFYNDLLGWTAVDHPAATDPPYCCFMDGETLVGGLLKVPETWGEGHPSCWTPSVQTEDIDELTAKAAALGGQVYQQPTDVPGVVRYSTIQDPTGAVISMYKLLATTCGSGCGCQPK